MDLPNEWDLRHGVRVTAARQPDADEHVEAAAEEN